MPLESNRLIIREFKKSEYDLFSKVYSDEQVMKYTYIDKISDQDSMKSFFTQLILPNFKKDRLIYGVFTKDSNKFIGICEIFFHYHINRVKNCEIGYYLLPSYWGKGYAVEIAKYLIHYCFSKFKVGKVVASCNTNNARSENIMKKIGMQKEAHLRKERYKDGHWDDEIKYGILYDEWETIKKIKT